MRPQAIPSNLLLIDAPAMLVATLMLLPIVKSGGIISRREGGILLAGYELYIGFLLLRSD